MDQQRYSSIPHIRKVQQLVDSVSGIKPDVPSLEFRIHSGEPPLPPTLAKFTVLGLDLGQAQDHSAACLLETDRSTLDVGPRDARVYCRYLRQWPIATKGPDNTTITYPYTQLADDVLDLNPSVIVPEFNGVGRPFVDILRERARQRGYQGRIYPVVTAASNSKMEEHREARGRHSTVPKQDLVTAVTILQQKGLLRLPHPKREPTVAKLLQELRDFQMRYTKAAHLQFGNADGPGKHDDLVISLSLACFYILRFGYRTELAMIGG